MFFSCVHCHSLFLPAQNDLLAEAHTQTSPKMCMYTGDIFINSVNLKTQIQDVTVIQLVCFSGGAYSSS